MFRSHQHLFLAIAINIFFLVLCIIFGELRFGAMDDYFMAAVLTGAHGTDYNVHMYFVNALYGYALLPLYQLFPKNGWYYIGEMFSVFLSFTTISYVLLKKIGLQWGLLISTTLIAFFASDFYLAVQFTQCAALLAATGMTATLWGINEKNYPIVALGAFMILWGSMMRWPAFLMGMPFLAATMLVQIKDCWRHVKPILITAAILSIVILGAYKFDQSLYEVPEYIPYKAIQGPRAALGDAHDYDIDAVFKDIEAEGKSVEDFKMLTFWKFYDTETFNIDNMRAYANITYRHKNKFPKKQIPRALFDLLYNSAGHYLCWIFFVFGIIILYTNPKRGLYPWLSLLVTLCMLAYLLSINRVVLRVENGFWIYAAILAILHFGKLPDIPQRIFVPSTIALLITCIIWHPHNIPTIKKQDVYDKVFQFINNHPNTLFMVSMPQYTSLAQHKLPPYLAEPIGGFRRTISFGFWTPYLPDITETLKEFGITNPLKEIVNDNVMVIGDGHLDEFLMRHYYDSVKVDNVESFENVHFFKYSIIEKDSKD